MTVTELQRALQRLERDGWGHLHVFADHGCEYFALAETIQRAQGLKGEPCIVINDAGEPRDAANDWHGHMDDYPLPKKGA
jgi:hypothetical protein